MSLEGKLLNVQIGDVVLISTPAKKVVASGFVTALSKAFIKLSPDDPYAPGPWSSGRTEAGKDSTYELSFFSEYKVLERYNNIR
jgi:hypothetical protein